ncbi:MAG: DUF1587 domain-containing protein, partial [Acidobacteria bacterium]|nr:DUF1587 domain-containing protein [Acidobacteriota bacterium]
MLAAGPAAGAARQAHTPQIRDGESARVLVHQYCIACHNDRAKTGGVSLQALDFSRAGQHADVLERVLRKVRNGEMPPAGRPRPDSATATAFTMWLERSLDDYAAAHPNPGRPIVHRLNRAEYSNAVRDLLAVDVKPGEALPIDDSGYGFDNIGDVLSTSPALLERYLSAAARISRLAVGDLSLKPVVETFEPPRDPLTGLVRRNERISDELPFGSRGGLSFQHYFPLDGTYVFRVTPTRVADAPEPIVLEIRLALKAG